MREKQLSALIIFCNEVEVRVGVVLDMKYCAANVLILT
jgi:hypothetical protein